MSDHDHLRALRDATEPTQQQIQRVKTRLGLGEAASITQSVLQSLPDPAQSAERRVYARLAIRQPQPYRQLAAIGLSLAAAAAWAIVLFPTYEKPVALQLEPTSERVALGDLVSLVSSGVGSAGGTEQHPHIRWESGRLDVDVVPKRGVRLSVETAEGTVTVVGTVFSVVRDVMGTRVEVSRGEVEVTCASQPPIRLRPGISNTCLPTTAAGQFGRARALASQGGSTLDVMAALDAASALNPSAPLAGEVLALRFETFRQAGNPEAAIAVASEYVQKGYSERAGAVAGSAAILALELHGCDAANGWLGHADGVTAEAIRLQCAGSDAP